MHGVGFIGGTEIIVHRGGGGVASIEESGDGIRGSITCVMDDAENGNGITITILAGNIVMSGRWTGSRKRPRTITVRTMTESSYGICTSTITDGTKKCSKPQRKGIGTTSLIQKVVVMMVGHKTMAMVGITRTTTIIGTEDKKVT